MEPLAIAFDVDGTLIDLAGAGRRALAHALAEELDREDPLAGVSLAGRTDLAIVAAVLDPSGARLDREAVDRVFRSYEARLPTEIARTPYGPTPGARDLLEALGRDRRVVIGLATGNLPAAARLKIESAGLPWIFEFGAYGADHAERADLVRSALAGAAPGLGACAWVVGDTPADVAAAHAAGARSLAVAQGPYSLEALATCAPDLVVADLAEALDRRFWLTPK